MKKLRIGISACFFHSDPKRPIFKGKTLQYLEQSMAHWVISEGVIAYMIPMPPACVSMRDWVLDLDGLVLQGGSDVSPKSYGQKALKPEWEGDYIRDQYEMELFHEFHAQKKPVLGICRGAQLINVACGGTVHQDIATHVPGSLTHRDWEIYDQNFHEINIDSKIFPGVKVAKVNSIHHQGIEKLGKNLVVEATSEKDAIIEAVRGTEGSFVYAVQWHPEFQDPKDKSLLDCKPLLKAFLKEAVK